jgi:hypothetical protein
MKTLVEFHGLVRLAINSSIGQLDEMLLLFDSTQPT